MIVVIFGLVGSGKSTVARALAKRLGAEVINSDVLRKRLAGLDPYANAKSTFGGGIYSEDFTEKVYERMIDEAVALASDRKVPVVLDATFRSHRHREKLKQRAEQKGIKVAFFYLDADEKVVKERLSKRSLEKSVSDADWSVYLKMKEGFDPPKDAYIIDANRSVEEIVDEIMAVLEGSNGLH